MNSLSRFVLTIAVLLLALTYGAKTLKAQEPDSLCRIHPLDPVCVAPNNYKVIYEDDDVRVLRFQDTPGTRIPKHQHSHPFQVYNITRSQRQFFQPDCKTKIGAVKILPPNQLLPFTMPIPVTHCESNPGKTGASLVIVEYKKDPAFPSAPSPAKPPVKSSRAARR
jgi:hypothetical protein